MDSCSRSLAISFVKGLMAVSMIFVFSPKIAALECTKGASQPTNPVDCLACNIHFEALNEPYEGQKAVAYTVFNRALNRASNAGATICAQVYAENQYSWTRPNDPVPDPKVLGPADGQKVQELAKKKIEEISKKNFQDTQDQATVCATHYHTKQKNVGGMGDYPAWSAWGAASSGFQKAGEIGGHLFSKDPGMSKCIKDENEDELRKLAEATGAGDSK